MEPRSLEYYCSGPSAKISKHLKKKKKQTSSTLITAIFLSKFSGTIQKADHCGTKGHYESLFPFYAAYLFSVLQSTAFLVMTRSPMAVILNQFHICCSLSPHFQYDLRSLGQDLLIYLTTLDVLIG